MAAPNSIERVAELLELLLRWELRRCGQCQGTGERPHYGLSPRTGQPLPCASCAPYRKALDGNSDKPAAA